MNTGELPQGDENNDTYQLIQRKSKELSREDPEEVRKRFHDTLNTLSSASAELIPESHVISPRVAARIVSSAAKLLMAPDEYKQAVTKRRRAVASRLPTKLESGSELLKKTIEARGKVPWSNAERDFFLDIVTQTEYQHPQGSRHPGKPNFELVAVALNEKFHDKKDVRTAYSLPAIRRMFLKKQGTYSRLKNNMSWSEKEESRLRELRNTVLHSGGKHRFNGTPDFKRIAAMLNEEFHPEQHNKGIAVRNANTCSQHLRDLLGDELRGESTDGQ